MDQLKILITGGNGYIAKKIQDSLAQKYNILTINRSHFDLTNSKNTKNWFSDKNFDLVIHTAIVGGSRLGEDDDSVYINNTNMFDNLEQNKNHFNKLISFGSGAELFQNTSYAASKRIINEKIKKIKNWYNIRIFGVFDENELETRFIKSNIIRYIKKEPMIIHTNKIMDFFYMKDLISLVNYYATNENLPKETNCSYEEKYTLKNIANMINNLDDHKVPIETINKKELEFYCGEATEIPVELIGLQKGIEKVYFKLLNQLQP
jgi:nucleoside-diphosphate-sugar epimerase